MATEYQRLRTALLAGQYIGENLAQVRSCTWAALSPQPYALAYRDALACVDTACERKAIASVTRRAYHSQLTRIAS